MYLTCWMEWESAVIQLVLNPWVLETNHATSEKSTQEPIHTSSQSMSTKKTKSKSRWKKRRRNWRQIRRLFNRFRMCIMCPKIRTTCSKIRTTCPKIRTKIRTNRQQMWTNRQKMWTNRKKMWAISIWRQMWKMPLAEFSADHVPSQTINSTWQAVTSCLGSVSEACSQVTTWCQLANHG